MARATTITDRTATHFGRFTQSTERGTRMMADPHGNGEVLHFGAPLEQAALAVVLLHGRGGTAADILSLGQAIGEPGEAYLPPQAKDHTWYPQSFLPPRPANEPFLSSALAKVKTVVRSIEEAGVRPDSPVLIGPAQTS